MWFAKLWGKFTSYEPWEKFIRTMFRPPRNVSCNALACVDMRPGTFTKLVDHLHRVSLGPYDDQVSDCIAPGRPPRIFLRTNQ